jgi:rhodanese-related sulfurtransferase
MMIKEIDAYDLQARIAEGDDFILLDIRSAGELAQGMLPDAEHLPMHLIPLRINELPKDKDVVLYCHSGARSYHACAYLAQQGYDNVINLRGGILGWARSGYQLITRMAS